MFEIFVPKSALNFIPGIEIYRGRTRLGGSPNKVSRHVIMPNASRYPPTHRNKNPEYLEKHLDKQLKPSIEYPPLLNWLIDLSDMPRRRINRQRKRRFVDANLDEPLTEGTRALVDAIQSTFNLIPRDWQVQAMQAVLKGRDVMIRAGIGSGKSLIFQGLSLKSDKAIVLVVAPLNGLMDNQVHDTPSITLNAIDLEAQAPWYQRNFAYRGDARRAARTVGAGRERRVQSSVCDAGAHYGASQILPNTHYREKEPIHDQSRRGCCR